MNARTILAEPDPTVVMLTWKPIGEGLPDSDVTVLVWLETGEWFSAWWDDDDETRGWYDAATGGRIEGVTHWAEPQGPAA